jgi:hypothetical protein
MASSSKVTVTDYDFVTGEVIEREATAEEIAEFARVSADAQSMRLNLA